MCLPRNLTEKQKQDLAALLAEADAKRALCIAAGHHQFKKIQLKYRSVGITTGLPVRWACKVCGVVTSQKYKVDKQRTSSSEDESASA